VNTKIRKSLAIVCILSCSTYLYPTALADNVAHTFLTQNASWVWSNGSVISVDANLEYINKWENSSVVGNYFEGLYYDSIFWYFQTDYLTDQNQNVRIIWSSNACSSGYGYKLGWYAYSSYYGFVDFDFSDDIFVYYCVDDNSLHWYSYSETIGFQNFEDISFPINIGPTATAETPSDTEDFRNDDTKIVNPNIWNTSDNPENDTPEAQSENSNFSPTTIQNEKADFNVERESLFYIIK